jgi:O-antigen ligase
MKFKNIDWSTICKWAVLILLSVSILWRGGKSLDMTWILTGVAAMVTIISHTINRRTGDREVPLLLWAAVMGFVVLTALSYWASTTQNYGLDEVLRTGALGLLFMWIIRIGSDEKEGPLYMNKLLQVFCCTVIVACVIGILVYIFQPVNRAVGTFFDYRFHTDYWPNAWAEFLLLAWPILLYWILQDFKFNSKEARSRVELLIRSIILGLVFGCLLLAYSRGAMLVFFAQIGLWAAIVYKKTQKDFPIQKVVPIAVILLAVSTITFLSVNSLRSQYYEVQNVQEKVTFTASEGTSSVSERGQFWAQSLNLALQKPLLGWGPYSFRFVQPQLQKDVLATSDHPHNVLLKILMERGVFALALFFVLIGIVSYRSAVVLLSKEVEVGTLTFSIRILMMVSLFGVLLHNMIDFNLQFVGIVLPFWLFFGMLMTYLDISSLQRVPARIARIVELLIATLLLIIALYEGGYLVVSSVGRLAEARGEEEVALVWYGRASGEFFKRDLLLSTAQIHTHRSDFAEAEKAVDAYMDANNQDFRALKRLGEIALIRGQKEKALDAYMSAYQKGKWNDLGVLLGIVEVHLAMDNKDEIQKLRPEIDGVIQKYSTAILSNTHFIAVSPNVEEFIAILNTMARLYPDDAPRYQVMAAKADHHALVERQRIESRPPGFLW